VGGIHLRLLDEEMMDALQNLDALNLDEDLTLVDVVHLIHPDLMFLQNVAEDAVSHQMVDAPQVVVELEDVVFQKDYFLDEVQEVEE
jgi:hypothetical protein